MNHKLAYTARQNYFNSDYYQHERGSPPKVNLYESASRPQDLAFRETYHYAPETRDFGNVKKLPEETQFMRNTMNSKMGRRMKSLNLDQEPELPSKFDDFLRQTMSYKSLKGHSRKLIEESPIVTKVNDLKQINSNNSGLKFHSRIGNEGMARVKSAGSLLQTSQKKEYDLLTKRIDRNNKMIAELKKTVKKEDNFLKNVNHNKPPAFIDLDKQKQPELVFRKNKKNEGLIMTPKGEKNLFSSCNSHMVEASKSAEKRLESETMISSHASISYMKKKHKISHFKECSLVDEFQEGKKLGEGKFGVVNLVRHKQTQGIFAMKKIPKSMIKSHMMVDQIALQIRIQSCLTHRHILGMYGFFDDKTHLYIVLEYMDGDTLYHKLKKETKMGEQETSFVIKQIAQAVDYLHDRGIVHRDIKPQNIVISNNVYKLCDFGWAAMCDERRRTYCGTFDYVSPEILEGVQYDITVDLWCLGVMTFELLTGKAPFYHVSRKQTMKRILNIQHHNLVFPEDMSEVAKDFIEKLVRKNPSERLKIGEVLKHQFIKNAELDL